MECAARSTMTWDKLHKSGSNDMGYAAAKILIAHHTGAGSVSARAMGTGPAGQPTFP
jgi:hypothetical protein